MCSSGVPHDGESMEDGTREAAFGFRSRLITSAIALMVAIPYAMVGLSWVSTTML
jgi:hypothetical protein